MAVLEIVKAGNPVLKQKAEPIGKVDSRLRKLLHIFPHRLKNIRFWDRKDFLLPK